MIFKKLIKKIKGDDARYTEYSKPLMTAEGYKKLHKKAKEQIFEEINLDEKKCGYAIDIEYFENLALHLQVVKKKSTLNYQHGRLLYSRLRNYLSKKSDKVVNILETGTARGFSSICLSKALNDSNRIGLIVTLDIIPHNKNLFWNCIDDESGKKTRAKLLEQWESETKNIIFLEGSSKSTLSKLHIDRIHFSFLDAQHTELEVLNEFNYVKSRQISGDIIIFDDYSPGLFDGVVNAIKQIEYDGLYEIEIINNTNQRGYVIATRK